MRSMKFQPRDGNLMLRIYDYDGMLPFRVIKQMFWSGKTDRAAQKRLAKLVNNRYLCRPTPEQYRTQPIPEPIYWLDWRGILWVAAQRGGKVTPPPKDSEYQLRRFDKRLREQGIRWLREPRFAQLYHDLSIVRFRLAVERALSEVGDKIPDAEKRNVQDAAETLKKTLETGSTEDIKRDMESLSQASHKLSEILYKKAAGEKTEAETASAPSETQPEGEVVDAEFEVDDQNK